MRAVGKAYPSGLASTAEISLQSWWWGQYWSRRAGLARHSSTSQLLIANRVSPLPPGGFTLLRSLFEEPLGYNMLDNRPLFPHLNIHSLILADFTRNAPVVSRHPHGQLSAFAVGTPDPTGELEFKFQMIQTPDLSHWVVVVSTCSRGPVSLGTRSNSIREFPVFLLAYLSSASYVPRRHVLRIEEESDAEDAEEGRPKNRESVLSCKAIYINILLFPAERGWPFPNRPLSTIWSRFNPLKVDDGVEEYHRCKSASHLRGSPLPWSFLTSAISPSYQEFDDLPPTFDTFSAAVPHSYTAPPNQPPPHHLLCWWLAEQWTEVPTECVLTSKP